jgi:DNA modification methylase
LRNSTIRGEAILDPFVGSGTTLIACEQLGRRCYAIELEPKYVDVVVERWESYTGKKAERIPASQSEPVQEVTSVAAN